MAPIDMLTSASNTMLGPVHLFFYSTLLGSQLYQSFIITKIAFISLPRPAFISLQKRLFPVYFRLQSALVLLTAATFPLGPSALIRSRGDWIPIAVAAGTAALNLLMYGPMTRRIMLDRAQPVPKDQPRAERDVAALKKRFSFAHAMSIHLNLVCMGATLWYGWMLASRLNFD